MSLGLDNLYSRYVYRVLRPDEDPYDNLTCKDPNSIRSIAQHVETGLRIPSQYISTSRNFEMAKQWLETANDKTSWIYGNRRTTIVQIDTYIIKSEYPHIANSAVDLTNYENSNYFLGNLTQKQFAYTYQEVVFSYCIPSAAVSVVSMNELNHYERQQSFNSSPQYYSPYGNSQVGDSLMRDSPSPSEETYDYRSYTDTNTSHSVYPRYQSRNNNNLNSSEDSILGLVACVVVFSPIILCVIVIALDIGVLHDLLLEV